MVQPAVKPLATPLFSVRLPLPIFVNASSAVPPACVIVPVNVNGPALLSPALNCAVVLDTVLVTVPAPDKPLTVSVTAPFKSSIHEPAIERLPVAGPLGMTSLPPHLIVPALIVVSPA